jgi:hypothetical protein
MEGVEMKMMKKLFLLAILIFWSVPAFGLRCGNDIISTGDTDLDVQLKLKKCGEVINRNIIKKEITSNYHLKNKRDIEMDAEERLVERWYIRITEQGGAYCYPLNFSGGILKEIGKWTKCD